jgi:anti-sigma factor RsiW
MNRRDIELLSSYLDGQLKPSDSARLERRLSSDPDLRAVLDDLRSARGLLRQLPMRKAPRNFTLTPKMVGKNPPLPRTYPAFKFVTVLATLLLFFSMGINLMTTQMASQPLAFGKGGGGAPEILSDEAPAAAPAAEEYAATEAPIMQAPAATEAPVEEPSAGFVPLPTATLALEAAPMPTTLPPSINDTARAVETPMAKSNAVTGTANGQHQLTPETKVSRPVPPVWQYVLIGIALLGVFIMLLMRRLAVVHWRGK